MKKIKVEYTFATGQFENAKPVVEIEIPEGMNTVEEFQYLHDMFHNLSDRKIKEAKPKEKTYPNTKDGKLQARKDGVDIDNEPYLDGEEDEGAKIENATRYNRG